MPVAAADFLANRATVGTDISTLGSITLGTQFGTAYQPYFVGGTAEAGFFLDESLPGVPATFRNILLSAWFNIQHAGGGAYDLFTNSGSPGVSISAFRSPGVVGIVDASSNFAILRDLFAGTAINPGINHLLVSCDTVAGTYEVLLNGVALSTTGSPTITPFTCASAGGLFFLFADFADDYVGELWFDTPASYESAAANIAKFYDAGTPVDPGADGSVPFGVAPLGYFTVRDSITPPPPDFPLVGVLKVLLPPAELQFCDADGTPFAGGTLEMYIVGTTTPKATWKDAGGTILNTNPIVLDSAGRAIIFGDGGYRTILRDADGNLIWDQPSFTYVSAAMIPVVGAATLADARVAMGIDDAIQVETDRALAAEAAEVIARDAAIAVETARAEAAEAAETAARIAADAVLQAEIDAVVTVPPFQAASASVGGDGHARITFPVAFAMGHTSAVVVTAIETGFVSVTCVVNSDRLGFDIWIVHAGTPIGAPNTSFNWFATQD